MPDEVRQAAQNVFSESKPQPPTSPVLEPGEIVLLAHWGAESPRRLALISARDDATGSMDVLLIAPEVEMATDLDLILARQVSGLEFESMAQAELYGPVFWEQAESLEGRVPETLRAAMARALETDGESLEGLPRGVPLAGSDDRRRKFKADELFDLDDIVGSCRSWLAGDPSETTLLDPWLLIPPPAGTPREEAEDQFLDLLDALEASRNALAVLSSDLIMLLAERGLLDEMLRWRTEFGLRVVETLERYFDHPDLSDDRSFDTGVDVLVAYLRLLAGSGYRTADVWSRGESSLLTSELLVIEGPDGRRCRARRVLLEAA